MGRPLIRVDTSKLNPKPEQVYKSPAEVMDGQPAEDLPQYGEINGQAAAALKVWGCGYLLFKTVPADGKKLPKEIGLAIMEPDDF